MREVGKPWDNADITAIIAASGSGKSHWIKARLAADPGAMVVVWDWMHEYGHAGRAFGSFSSLAAAVSKGRPGIYAYYPADFLKHDEKRRHRAFADFCQLAYWWGGLTVIVEELMHVTKSGWAPAQWSSIITSGRHRHLRVIATTQRPVLCDKTFISGATLVRVGYLGSKSDKATMADILDVPVADIRALRKRDWIQRDDAGARSTELYQGARPKKKRPTKEK